MPPVTRRIAALLAAAVAVLAPDAAAERPEGKPKDIGLVEKAGTHLAQIDVSVAGDPEAIERLTALDFTLRVGYVQVERFTVDRVCQNPRGAAPPVAVEASAAGSAAPVPVKSRPTTFLFFFDQPHLTQAGRQRALDLAREMVPRLVTGENRGMIVSTARSLVTIAGLTSSVPQLLQALDRLEKDRTQWDSFATLENKRVGDVMNALNDPMGGVAAASAEARRDQAEEIWQMQRSIGRLSMVLGALDPIDPPKAVVYFSDTLRSRPGGHYQDLFPARAAGDGRSALLESDPSLASLSFDRVVSEATAHGVRLYTIEAQGLTSLSMTDPAIPYSARVSAAQHTLAAMALETGGKAFLNGVSGARIASGIVADLSCVFLISFDPAGLPEDRPIPVSVQVRRSGLTAQARGRLVVQSEASRRTSKLLAAFAAPEAAGSPAIVRAAVIPTGFDAGTFKGLVQIAVPPSPYPSASWDLGASLVSTGKVREDTSTHLEVGSSGVPLVLEREMSFSAGPFEIVAVAHETSTDQIASRTLEGAWPDLRDVPAAVGPIALLQPSVGAFERDGATHKKGSLALGERDPVRREAATAMVSLVCRGEGVRTPLEVVRRLTGETSVDFQPIELDPPDTCAQVRDLIRPNTMGAGEFRYEILVLQGGKELARGERRFAVPDARPPATGAEGR